MFLTQLVVEKPKKGDIFGTCVWCGCQTDEGHELCVSNNFTGWSFFTKGNCLCPFCYTFLRDQSFRRKTWLAVERGVQFLERGQIKHVLLDPPEPPWFLYISKVGQKQSWLNCINSVNFSRQSFYIGYEGFEFPVYAKLGEVRKLFGLARKLHENKISKTELLTGCFKMKTFERAIKNGYEDLLKQAQSHAKQPIWEVICHVL